MGFIEGLLIGLIVGVLIGFFIFGILATAKDSGGEDE